MICSRAGPGGTAGLAQVVRFGAGAARAPDSPPGAWLGGTKTSDAELKVQFLDAGGRVKSTATIGPVGQAGAAPVLAYRAVTGTIPAGAIQRHGSPSSWPPR